jgi:hypothetical protein
VELDAEDPLGLDRQRTVSASRNDEVGEKTISGAIAWGNTTDTQEQDDYMRPQLDVRTTMGNVKLMI